MKNLLIVFLLTSLLLLTTCALSGSSANNQVAKSITKENSKSSDLNIEATNKLHSIIAKDSPTAELKDSEIIIDKARIKVSVNTEHESNKDGKWVFAARFDVKLIDKQEILFTVGSIGIGENQNDAVQTSIDEWIGLFGTALSRMIANSKSEISVDNFTIFPGLLGIRGEKPSQDWIDGSDKMNKKIINVLLPIIKKSNKENTSLNLLLTADETGNISGECRINNEISPEIMEQLKKLDWKTNSGSYMFKQFYLIKKN